MEYQFGILIVFGYIFTFSDWIKQSIEMGLDYDFEIIFPIGISIVIVGIVFLVIVVRRRN